MKKLFVYGTLKKGFYNHGYLKDEETKFLGAKTVSGYTLYSCESYPMAVKTKNAFIIGELYEVCERVFHIILRMEIGSGFYLDFIDGVFLFYMAKERLHIETEKPIGSIWTSKIVNLPYGEAE